MHFFYFCLFSSEQQMSSFSLEVQNIYSYQLTSLMQNCIILYVRVHLCICKCVFLSIYVSVQMCMSVYVSVNVCLSKCMCLCQCVSECVLYLCLWKCVKQIHAHLISEMQMVVRVHQKRETYS